MTLDLICMNRTVPLDDLEWPIFELIRRHGIEAPTYARIEECSYGTTRLVHDTEIERLKGETVHLRAAYATAERARLKRSKGVWSKTPGIERQILDDLLADDSWMAKFTAIIALCDTALDEQREVCVEGD